MALLALASGAGGIPITTRPPGYAAVYEAYFRQFDLAGRMALVLEAPLAADEVPEASPELSMDFPRTNEIHRREDFGRAPVRLLSVSDFRQIFCDEPACGDAWTVLRRRFHDARALLQLSRVRLSVDGREAQLLAQLGSGWQYSSIDRYRFVRDGTGWKLVDQENLGRG